MLKAFTKWMEDLPLIAKIIFAIPFLDILWVVYRIAISLEKEAMGSLILAIIFIVVGLPFLWLVDIITIALKGKVFWFYDFFGF